MSRMDELATASTEPQESQTTPTTSLLTVQEVAQLLRCSARTVYRLHDSGRLPQAVHLGALVRWPQAVIEQWINDGCPARRERGQK